MKSSSGKFSLRSLVFFVVAFLTFFSASVSAQEAVIVQPGAPGQPTKVLPADTTAKLPPISPKDAEFMRGMIMHHAQAVEMTALIEERTTNQKLRKLGAKISHSQADEIAFMKRWLVSKGEKTEMEMKEDDDEDSSSHGHSMMPGMLTAKQMERLKNAKGAEFDRLFLKGMIQHHEGALQMVKKLFSTGGTGQDAELFNFAMDVDTGQRAEIKIMQAILDEKSKEEKK